MLGTKPECSRSKIICAKNPKLTLKKLQSFFVFVRKLWKAGSYEVFLQNLSVLLPWMSALSSPAFFAMPYPYTFVYRTFTVLERHISGFPENVCQFAVIEKLRGIHPCGFKPNFSDCFVDVSCPLFVDSTVLSSVMWLAKMPMRPGSKEPLKRSENSISFQNAVVQLFSPSDGAILDP